MKTWSVKGLSLMGAASAALATGLLPAAAAAQESGLEEIVITAERRSANLQDTPIAVTALTESALDSFGVAVINDLAALVPNLTATTGPQGSGDANFFIRGVGQLDFNVTNDPGVGLYVDGVYFARTIGAALDSGDIAQIEVLRGPQGTLFGRNTLGGVVSATTKKPELGTFGGSLNGVYGERERREVEGAFNAPLGDKAAIRIGGFMRFQDGFAYNPTQQTDTGLTDRRGARAAFKLEPTSKLTIDLSADWTLDKSNQAPSVLLAISDSILGLVPADTASQVQDPDNFYTTYQSASSKSRNEATGATLTLTYDLGGATLKSISAYRTLDGLSEGDFDGTSYAIYDQVAVTDQSQFSQELQISGTAGRLDYLAGLYYFAESADQVLDLCYSPGLGVPTTAGTPCSSWVQGSDQETKSYAGFGQVRYNVTNTVSLTAGGRYTFEEKDIIANHYFDFVNFTVPIVTDLVDSADFEKFTPKLGVEYKPNTDLLVFASYAQGFRSGGFNGRIISSAAQTVDNSVPSYDPDTNDTYELGFKSDLIDSRLRLNGTLFYSAYKDIQQSISDAVVGFRIANAGDADLYGFEIEATAVPIEPLRLSASVGYTNSEFKNVPSTVGDNNGNVLPFSPEWTLAFAADYRFALGALGSITPHIDYRWQSDQYFTAANSPLELQEGYGLLGTRVSWADANDKFTVSVFGLNITDEEYYTFGQDTLANQGVATAYLGKPSEWGVSAGVKF